jgi:hypothetical protein
MIKYKQDFTAGRCTYAVFRNMQVLHPGVPEISTITVLLNLPADFVAPFK